MNKFEKSQRFDYAVSILRRLLAAGGGTIAPIYTLRVKRNTATTAIRALCVTGGDIFDITFECATVTGCKTDRAGCVLVEHHGVAPDVLLVSRVQSALGTTIERRSL